MPISVKCAECGKGLRAPDALAGKKAKCPQCGGVIPIPAAVSDAEEFEDDPPVPKPTAPKPSVPKASAKSTTRAAKKKVEEEEDYGDADMDADEESEDGRRACPMCGEMIVATAAKCRYCGEVLDSDLRKSGKSRSGRRGKAVQQDVKTIAKHQKALIICILIQIAAFCVQLGVPPQLRPIVSLAYLVTSLAATVFVFMLAMKLYSTGMGIFLGILSLIPCLGLLILLMVNSKATTALKESGIKVGFLGAKLSDL